MWNNKEYYIVLTGAKKNIGDFLITQKAIELLNTFRPDRELIQYNSWENLDPYLEILNNSKAILILGGPGYQPYMYPDVYKLVSCLENLKVPVIPIGLGWSGYPGDFYSLLTYAFSAQSTKLLHYIVNAGFPLSCRDYYTYEVLKLHGFSDILMTGCPVWYDIDSVGKQIRPPGNLNKIVFTPAQKKLFKNQSISIMHYLRDRFKESTIYCAFHRGIGTKDSYTHDWEINNTLVLKNAAEKNGLIPVDFAFDLNKLKLYDECDIHIGYRVHGHLYFLSKRKPSFLLHEDGRGIGLTNTLQSIGIDAFTRNFAGNLFKGNTNGFIIKSVNKIIGLIKPNRNTLSLLKMYLDEELANGFTRFCGISHIIDKNFDIMKNFLASLP